MADIAEYWKNFIDGEWVDGGAGRVDVENPGTGEVLASHAMADAGDVDRAVRAARAMHDGGALADLRPVERGRMVKAMGQHLLENLEEAATLLTLEQGKPYWESVIEIEGAARYFEYYGNQAETVEGRQIPLGAGYFDFTLLEPYGVTAHIVPWNYPLEMAARSVSAALATGNACVVKTPELTPISSVIFGRAAEAVGLPNGALNLLCGAGPEAGAALSQHADIDMIVFTGSVETGRKIATAAARNVVPGVLELGGKSAAIVYPDADLDAFLSDVRWGIFFNAGQVCSAMSRVIVHASIHDELVDRIASVASGLSVGPGIERREFGDTMGSLVSAAQTDRAIGFCQRPQSQGAKAVTGGRAMNIPGHFVEPTVFAGVTPDMEIATDEVFGPVLSVMPFSDDHDAIKIANATDYGLVGGVFTRDLDRATGAARALRAGQVFVNEWYAGGVETPFGGFGKSGYGREKGREALWNYVQTKNVAIKLGGN